MAVTVWVCRDEEGLMISRLKPKWLDLNWAGWIPLGGGREPADYLTLPKGFCDLKIGEAIEVELVPTGKKIVAKDANDERV